MTYMIDCTYTVNDKGKTIHGAGNLEFEIDHVPQTKEELDEAEKEAMEQFGFDGICVKRWVEVTGQENERERK